MKPKEKASFSLIHVFISISIVIRYRCTVSEISQTHESAAKHALRTQYSQPLLFGLGSRKSKAQLAARTPGQYMHH